jgi:hypothetical protein
MAFLDNSRDIILDAVLTDLGRKRLAEGNGGFKIAKFALGDDEINYELYDKNNTSGSAYYDLEILQSPVFEAFTNNISTMNSRLVTYSSNNLLYLPVLKLNEKGTSVKSAITIPVGEVTRQGGTTKTLLSGLTNTFAIAVNQSTFDALTGSTNQVINGINNQQTEYIRVDQGIDSTELFSTVDLISVSSDLVELRYTVEIDNRFGRLAFNQTTLEPNFIDDDDVASYTFALRDTAVPNVSKLAPKIAGNEDQTNTNDNRYAISGPRGTALHFGVFTSDELVDSNNNYYFDTFGGTTTFTNATGTFKTIHTTITVTGQTTGYSLDIPVVFIKKV